MIRKLKSGKYRLYSKKKDPKQESAGISELSIHAKLLKTTNEQFNSSSANDCFRIPSTQIEGDLGVAASMLHLLSPKHSRDYELFII